ncbi:MAG: tetratricopeptide repeat protein [Phycisphaerae bacterium]
MTLLTRGALVSIFVTLAPIAASALPDPPPTVRPTTPASQPDSLHLTPLRPTDEPHAAPAAAQAGDDELTAQRSTHGRGTSIDRRALRPAEIDEYRRDARNWRYSPYLRSYGGFGDRRYSGYDSGGFFDSYHRQLDRAYVEGRLDERDDERITYNQNDMAARAQRVLSAHDRAQHAGLERLRRGDYAQAVVALTLASELDQGDPACRIHLAQARLAMGHYAEAGAALRRALQLQPALAYMNLNWASEYPAGELATFSTAIGPAAAKASADTETRFLFAYLRFHEGKLTEAYPVFSRLAGELPNDPTIQAYLKISKPPMR